MIRTLITFIVIVVPSLYFGFKGHTVEMGLGIVLGAIAGAFLNLDKFERFKGAGFEAEMKKVVTEAYATIENMKEVAKPLIVTILSNMTYANRIGGSSFNEKNKYKNELVKLATSIKVYDDEVKNAIEDFHHHHIWDTFYQIISKTNYLFDDRVEKTGSLLRVNLDALMDRKSKNYPTEHQINDAFASFLPYVRVAYEEEIQDYLYYTQHKNPRPSSNN